MEPRRESSMPWFHSPWRLPSSSSGFVPATGHTHQRWAGCAQDDELRQQCLVDSCDWWRWTCASDSTCHRPYNMTWFIVLQQTNSSNLIGWKWHSPKWDQQIFTLYFNINYEAWGIWYYSARETDIFLNCQYIYKHQCYYLIVAIVW